MEYLGTEKPNSKFADKREYIVVVLSSLLVIILLGLITYGGNRSMDAIQERATNIVERNFVKLNIVENMRVSARERTLILQRMVMEEDPFKRDEDFLLFNKHAYLFGTARNRLIELGVRTEENALLIKQSILTEKAVEIQEHVIDLVNDEQKKEAIDQLINHATPAQNEVLAVLNEISALQYEIAAGAVESGKKENQLTHRLSIIAFIFAAFTSILIATISLYTITRSNRNKEKYLQEIQRANHAKSVFVANMSHEIRTPLTAVIGFAEAALDPEQTKDEHRASINTIVRGGKHLLNILNSILDLSKIEAEKLTIEKEQTTITEIIDDVSNVLRLQAEEKGIVFTSTYRFPIPRRIITDSLRLKQILFNLGGNAIKFTSHGSVNFKISYDFPTQRLIINVIDTGIGLTLEQQRKLFAAFVQADSSMTKRYGGTGLGLHLSMQLAQLLGGTITLKSEANQGSEFMLSIYAECASGNDVVSDMRQIDREQVKFTTNFSYEKLSGIVLVAEDSRDNQILLKMFLTKFGLETVIAENGQQAVELTSNRHFDLVLMDMQMPVLDGMAAVEILRKKGCPVPIIAVTANALKEDRERCLKAGCNDFISKPITLDGLYKVIKRQLAERPSSSSQ